MFIYFYYRLSDFFKYLFLSWVFCENCVKWKILLFIISFNYYNIDLIVLSNDTVDLYNSKSIRATQGAMFALPIIYRDLEKELDEIKKSNIKIIGTSLNTNNSLDSLEKIDRYAIVLGNEARGAKESTLEKTDINVIIETNKKLESLNVSIAGAIMMYELNKK